MILSFCGFVVLLWDGSCCVMPCSLSSCFFSTIKDCDHLAWGRGSWSMCFSCICLFILHASVCPFSLPLGVRECLWLVIVALPGLFFINLFIKCGYSGLVCKSLIISLHE